MDLKELQKNWDEFGKTDPLCAILFDPDKIGNKWQIDEFFRTGKEEAKELMKYIESLSINIPRRKALDFGCGVGRVTQSLACYFDEVYGIDIAPSMIELAKKYNRHGDKCKYYLNETNDLKLFNDNVFDFIYSNITLQHMKPQYARNYIKEFLRVLILHGLIIFQLPSESIFKNLKKLGFYSEIKIKKLYAHLNGQPIMETYVIKREEMVTFLERNGFKIMDIAQNQSAGPHWVSFRYCVTKE